MNSSALIKCGYPKYALFPLVAAAILLASCGGNSSPARLSTVVVGLTAPLGLQQPNDDTGRLFIVEQGGMIRIVKNGSLLSMPFLDITAKVHMEDESGLLGMAFHPDYVHNRRFFVNYVRQLADGKLQTVIAEFQASLANPDKANSASERDLLFVSQPFSNHKAGQLAFGPEGDLYFGLGDGGGAGDPFGNGQNTHTLLGKMLRIDVDSPPGLGLQYAIRPTIRSSTGAARRKSLLTVSEIHGASRSTIRLAVCSSETLARTNTKRWI